MSVNDASAVSPNPNAPMPVSIWFDMQAETANEAAVPIPVWARELAQAYVDNDVCVLAHPDSAYAKMGLVCDIAKESPWPDDSWSARLTAALKLAKQKNMKQLILLLPHRSAPVLWGQWSLIHLERYGGYLDNLTGLFHGVQAQSQALHRPDSNRWLMIDRVMTYGTGLTQNDFLTQMRAFNPLALWVHDDGFLDKNLLLQPINAYHTNVPITRIPLKNEDLRAWGTNKVVYFATLKEVNRTKVIDLFEKWRQQYGQQMVRLWAVVRIKEPNSRLLVTSIHHLWAASFSSHDASESRFWIVGEHLDATQLQTEFEQCVA
ncbi:MAG: hypothetical protein LWW74_02050 [Burkholderiales bacterium]|nr:hypothetical protein [Burkholderiales bacterium]